MIPARAFLFDLDGTLIDSLADLTSAANRVLLPLGSPRLPPELVRAHVGRGATQLLRGLLQHTGLPEELLEPSVHRFLAAYAELSTETTVLYPGMREALETLPHPAVVLTNKNAQLSRDILHSLGLTGRFLEVYGGDTFPFRKPDPRTILEILRLHHWQADDVWMVGDSLYDVQAARGAGVRMCAVSYGLGQRAELEAASPELLLAQPRELILHFMPKTCAGK